MCRSQVGAVPVKECAKLEGRDGMKRFYDAAAWLTTVLGMALLALGLLLVPQSQVLADTVPNPSGFCTLSKCGKDKCDQASCTSGSNPCGGIGCNCDTTGCAPTCHCFNANAAGGVLCDCKK